MRRTIIIGLWGCLLISGCASEPRRESTLPPVEDVRSYDELVAQLQEDLAPLLANRPQPGMTMEAMVDRFGPPTRRTRYRGVERWHYRGQLGDEVLIVFDSQDRVDRVEVR